MTAETLHDALTLLPADLIAAADKKRNRKTIRIHWQRWAAMAACLAMVLSFGLLLRSRLLSGGKPAGSAEIAPQAALSSGAPEEAEAVEMPAAGTAAENGGLTAAAPRAEPQLQDSIASTMVPDHGTRYVNTPDNLYTTACKVHGPEVTLITSREELEAYRDEWDNSYLLDDLMTACEGCDDIWFQAHDLVLIPVYPVPAADSVTVTQVAETEEGLEVHIVVSQPDENTECTTWHILLETEKGQLPNADAVTLIFE